jgi:hypothetical protein
MKIQLLTFPGCPNAVAAREALRRALVARGLPPRFEEVDVTAPETPEAQRAWGSPTILVDDRDVAGAAPSGQGCRIYEGAPADRHGVPPDELIGAALDDAQRRRPRWMRSLALLPGAILVLLPVAHCPACLGAYFAVLSAVGLGFMVTERVLAPLIGLFLVLGIGTVAWSAKSHRRLGPLVVTLVGSAAVVAGRLVWTVPAALFCGVALLVGAALWNLWLKRPQPEPLVQVRFGRTGGTAP